MSSWDKYSRLSLNAATAVTSIAFSAAKNGTKLGFSIARIVASSVVGLAGSAVDHTLFGGSIGAGPALGGAVSTTISVVEALTLTPILIGESIASTTLVAAQSSLSVLQAVSPESAEASFSLASFITLVRREWVEDMKDSTSPANKHSFAELLKAVVAWAVLQALTSDWQEKQWFKHLKEIPVNDKPHKRDPSSPAPRRASMINVTKDIVYPNQGGQIIAADIGEAFVTAAPASARAVHHGIHDDNSELKATLRRFSKLALAGYGGAGLLFLGVPLTPSATAQKFDEEAQLAAAVGSSEEEALDSSAMSAPTASKDPSSSYSWWDVVSGKHDTDILLRYARSDVQTTAEDSASAKHPAIDTVQGGNVSQMPKFWVLTDHTRREIVLVLRGTMSLNELAVDLTCDPAEFHLPPSGARPDMSERDEQETLDEFGDQLESIPGSFRLDLSTPPSRAASLRHHQRQPSGSSTFSEAGDTYQVHGGILKMAQAMGNRGKPVHAAVKHALRQNDGYNLIICGHSLGAGVAGLLALMWADPHTCLTHRTSGLPAKRTVAAYCYAPPCLVSSRLSQLAASSNLVTSFVYSHDLFSRLSLGSVRDVRRAAAWLCEAEKEGRGDGYGGLTARALKSKTRYGKPEDAQWFLAIRKTLEANMNMAHLFPAGRVLWAIRKSDLNPSQGADKLQLFEVQDVEQVFGQIAFSKDMLSSHGPHQYDRVLHELL